MSALSRKEVAANLRQMALLVAPLAAQLQGSADIVEQDDPVEPTPPIAPSDLVARRGVTAGKIELAWTHVNTEFEDVGFEIQRDEDGLKIGVKDFVTVANIIGDVSTWEDDDSDTSADYAYRVRSISKGGWFSAWSNVAEPGVIVIEQPPDPTVRTKVSAGFSFDGKTGAYLLAAGTYTAPAETESGLDLKGESRDGVIITVPSGKQWIHRGATDVKLSTLTIDGKLKGGAATKLNDKGMLIPGDDWSLENVRVTGALGVNCGVDGKNFRAVDSEFDDGGSAGCGGKADSSFFLRCIFHNNNVRVLDSDGAVMGKFTRSNGMLIVDCQIYDGTNCGAWWDINNSDILCIRVTIKDIRLSKPESANKLWLGAGFKTEIAGHLGEGIRPAYDAFLPAGFAVDLKLWNIAFVDCNVYNTYSYAYDVNECTKVLIYGGEADDAPSKTDGGVLGVRFLARKDAGDRAKDWVLMTVYMIGVKFTKGKGTITGSGAGVAIDRKKYDIQVTDCIGTTIWNKVA